MTNKVRIGILAAVLLIAATIFFLPQLQDLFGMAGTKKGEVTENILLALQEAEKQNKPVFIDFYGQY